MGVIYVVLFIVLVLVVIDFAIKKYNRFKCKNGLHTPYAFEGAMLCAHCDKKLD